MIEFDDESQFILTQRQTDGFWTWGWLAGFMASGCVINGTRAYSTKAGALRSGRAAVKRLQKFCIELNRGDM